MTTRRSRLSEENLLISGMFTIRSDRYPFLIDTPRFADTGNTIITIKFRKDIFRECRTDSIDTVLLWIGGLKTPRRDFRLRMQVCHPAHDTGHIANGWPWRHLGSGEI